MVLRDAGVWLGCPHAKRAKFSSWLFFTPETSSVLTPQPAPGAWAAHFVSILNLLQSRPELGQLPIIAFVSDTDAEGRWGDIRRILHGQLNTPIPSCLVLPTSFSAAPPVERQTSLTLLTTQHPISGAPLSPARTPSSFSIHAHPPTSSKFSPSYRVTTLDPAPMLLIHRCIEVLRRTKACLLT